MTRARDERVRGACHSLNGQRRSSRSCSRRSPTLQDMGLFHHPSAPGDSSPPVRQRYSVERRAAIMRFDQTICVLCAHRGGGVPGVVRRSAMGWKAEGPLPNWDERGATLSGGQNRSVDTTTQAVVNGGNHIKRTPKRPLSIHYCLNGNFGLNAALSKKQWSDGS